MSAATKLYQGFLLAVPTVLFAAISPDLMGQAAGSEDEPARQMISASCLFAPGAINGVLIRRHGKQLAVYGWDGPVEKCLLTHGRRDVVWRAAPCAPAALVAPARARYALEKGADFWNGFATTRYHDYGQQTTKIVTTDLKVSQWVGDGDVVAWEGLQFHVLETPGFTRGGVTYTVDLDGKKVGFTGDLIYGDGKLLDLYSFQDAIPEAQIRGYHGYGGRLAMLVESLDKIVDADLDLLAPARGPLIQNPADAAKKLKMRVQALYHNYLSTNALHWYFKEERMKQCGARVLGKDANIELMKYSRHEQTPDWIYENSTSRMVISESGRGFLLDCGNTRVIDGVKQLIEQGVIDKVEGIFVTHFHDDHTDSVQEAAATFQCPVYATPEYADVLERPEAYHLPAMTANPIKNVKRMKNGQQMAWHEYQFTFHFFPGQTYYHGALFVEKKDERPVFFIGDAFAPSGIDDYCVQNRNLLGDGNGYLLCFDKVRKAKDCWLINEHIQYVFDFSRDELDYLEKRYRQRQSQLAELFPWDDPNYGVDEQWAVLYPRGAALKPGKTLDMEVRITNYSPHERVFHFTPHLPDGVTLVNSEPSLRLAPGKGGNAKLTVEVAESILQGQSESAWRVMTMDIRSDGMEFKHWADAYLTIAP